MPRKWQLPGHQHCCLKPCQSDDLATAINCRWSCWATPLLEGLPLLSVLSALVQDPATTQALAQGLAAAEFLAPQFASLVAVSFVSPFLPTPEEALLTWEVTRGSSNSHHMLAPIGEGKYCCLAVQYSRMWWPVDAHL